MNRIGDGYYPTRTDADGDGYYAEPDCGTPDDCDDTNSRVDPG